MNRLVLAAIVAAVVFVSGCVVQQVQQPAVQPPLPEEVPAQQPIVNVSTAVVKSGDAFSYVDKLHWGHMPVVYSLDESVCGPYETSRIKRAFADITNSTNGAVYFRKANGTEPEDISITCSFVEDCYKTSVDVYSDYTVRSETICGHQLGIARTTFQGSRILNSSIEMFGLAGFAETAGKGPSGFYVGTCGHAITEVHELLHAFGYQHSDDNASIMYPEADTFSLITQKEGSCIGSSREIDSSIAGDLIRTYSGQK